MDITNKDGSAGMDNARTILNHINEGISWDAWTLREQHLFALCFIQESIRDQQTQESFEQERNHLSLHLFNRFGTTLPKFLIQHLDANRSIRSDKRLLLVAGELRALLLSKAKRRNPLDKRIS